MYIKRAIEKKIISLLEHFPAIAILGPRQAGKTTLVKEIRSGIKKECIYLDLENPIDAGVLDHPLEFFNSVQNKTIIIDEIQRKPDLFPVLRSAIDNNRINGRFILLGSASTELLFMSNETLAGRVIYMELTPFSYSEIQHLSGFREHWMKGGFPIPFLMQDSAPRREWFKSFLLSYIERDLRLLGLNTSSSDVRRLFYMLTNIHGGLLNYNNLANSLGISSPTVKNAVSFFERSFIIRLLQPWYANVGKRLIKSPKFYFRDSGIINHMLGILSYEELLMYPMLGKLWEGYVIEDMISTLGDEYHYFFYRTADGTECDLVIYRNNRCIAAIDIKFAPKPRNTKSMTITMQDLKPQNSYFVIPDCPALYKMADKCYVGNPFQVMESIK